MKTNKITTIPKAPLLWRGVGVRLLMLITIITLQSCCDNIPPPEFTADQLEWIPYNEGDTLIFKSDSTGDTLSFYVESVFKTEEEGRDCGDDKRDHSGAAGYSISILRFGSYPNSLEEEILNHHKLDAIMYGGQVSSFPDSNIFSISCFSVESIDFNTQKAIQINNNLFENTVESFGNNWNSVDSVIIAKKFGLILMRFSNNESFILNI